MGAVDADWVALPGTDIGLPPNVVRVDAPLPDYMQVFVVLKDYVGRDAVHAAATKPGIFGEDYSSKLPLADELSSEKTIHGSVGHFAASHGLISEEFHFQVDGEIKNFDLGPSILLLSGSSIAILRVFKAELIIARIDDADVVLRNGPIYAPRAIAAQIANVIGLDRRPLGMRTHRPKGAASGPPLKPSDIAKKYHFPAALPAALPSKVVVLEFGGRYFRQDILSFLSSVGASPLNISIKNVDVLAPSYKRGDNEEYDVEVTLDIDLIAATVPNLELYVVSSTRDEAGWMAALQAARALDPDVVSISWGMPEDKSYKGFKWTAATLDSLSRTFEIFSQDGITVVAATGDEGSQCGVADGRAHVKYPASDPNVLACGGTKVVSLADSDSVWTSTGGGISNVFQLPDWQTPAKTVLSVNDGATGRGVPDVAGHAFPGFSINFTNSSGAEISLTVGGTSAAVPLYAGLIALIDQALTTRSGHRRRVGCINKLLYSLYDDPKARTKVFEDLSNPVTNSFAGAPGYASRVGWDACTGLGVIVGQELLDRL